MRIIKRFDGMYDWLSNFELVTINYRGYLFPSTENAYQACKSKSIRHMLECQACTPGQSKRLGRTCPIRDDWDDIRLKTMFDINMIKYSDPKYSLLLVHTGHMKIVEGNYWHDNYFGDCYCPKCEKIKGQNNLGKIIMKIRDIIGG